jgi:phosphomannomutase
VIDTNLRARAEEWMKNDPSDDTREELRAILARTDERSDAELRDRFSGPLEFGTAGLRGVLGAGESRMNRAVVLRATHGLGKALIEYVQNAKTRGVVIGFDGRRMSREFAEDTACALAALGVRAHLFAAVCPTPVTSFAVKHLGAAGGVMVTASHNPPEYNGYKVYWENSAQITPPNDSRIATLIDGAPVAKDVPRLDFGAARSASLVTIIHDDVLAAYDDAIAALRFGDSPRRDLRIVYTAMHGVGNRFALRALARAGFTDVFSVPEQAEPDGAFPTVAFPNPEEKGAMDLSLKHARDRNADLILANDPDADRLAVAIPSEKSPTKYLQLTGNQVGVLLGHHLLVRGPKKKNPLVIASIVSSPELGNIARALGVRYEETLTGFKWIANRAMDHEKNDAASFVFGYEEALGYTVGDVVRDKDGVSGAMMFADLAAQLASEGRTIHDELEAIARKFGLFVSGQINVVRKGTEGPREIADVMDRIRKVDAKTLGPFEVTEKIDFAKGARGLPATNMLAFDLQLRNEANVGVLNARRLKGGSRVIARPSGTEPKAKFYFDVSDRVAENESLDAATARAKANMKSLQDAFAKLAGV